MIVPTGQLSRSEIPKKEMKLKVIELQEMFSSIWELKGWTCSCTIYIENEANDRGKRRKGGTH